MIVIVVQIVIAVSVAITEARGRIGAALEDLDEKIKIKSRRKKPEFLCIYLHILYI
jgi:hypothetical protein